jgi:hypothetical protein
MESGLERREGNQAFFPFRSRAKRAERSCASGRDEIEALWELRFGHKKWRVWGVLRGSTYYFLWWDEHHKVCKGLPKEMARK